MKEIEFLNWEFSFLAFFLQFWYRNMVTFICKALIHS